MLSSSVFEPSEEIRHLHFHFHMHGVDMGRLRLEAFSSAGWTELWARAGAQGQDWNLAAVHLPPNVTAVRFVGTTFAGGWYSDMALDGIATGLPAVEFDHLTCNFRHDACLWQSTGASSWQVAGDAGGQWLEASGNSSQASEWILETAALFNTTEEKALLFDYQLSGSETVALELQHKTSAGGWQRLWSESGSRGAVWHAATVSIPAGSVGFRFVANVSELDLVKLDSFLAASTESDLASISCSFEQDTCKWVGDWRRLSGPSLETAAFHAESYASAGGVTNQVTRGKFRVPSSPVLSLQVFTLTSPFFGKLANVSYLEFAFHMFASGIGKLELWYLKEGRWSLRWSRQGNQGADWLQAKVTLPTGVEMLRFVNSESRHVESHVSLDAILAWEGPGAAPAEFLNLYSGNYHNCAVLKAEGLLKCWGYVDGRLGYGSEENVGLVPGEMGENLPVVDLGEPGVRVTQAAGGTWHTCAVLETGVLKCFGDNEYGKLGYGHTRDVGDEPFEMGEHLPAVDLGPGAEVVQVAARWLQTCALLRGGRVKCFGQGPLLGLGDQRRPEREHRGDDTGEMGSELPAVDLGTDFEAVQLAVGDFHSCALSSQGAVKCWGRSDRLGLGLGDTAVYIGASPNEMGDALPAVDLGLLPAVQITAGDRHTCVLSDGSVKCWGRNHRGQLGHGTLEDAGDQPGEMGTNLPATNLGDGMTAVYITAGSHFNCAILQDATLKCWGEGSSGQLGQGNTEDLGDEPSEMGSNLRAVGLGNLEVRDVSAGYGHTCVLLDDDSTRCWGDGSAGQLGIGSARSVGSVAGELGVALVPAELFPMTVGAGLQGVSVLALTADHGFARGLLQMQHDASVGLVCDDGFNDRVAQVACRDLGMAGGRTLSLTMWGGVGAGAIVADNMRCTGTEVSLRDCVFRGWHLHDCTPQEAAGLECESDAWSEYTPAGSPAGRQDASMVWDSETQSAWMFGGHASNAFLYFADLWHYDWPRRAWTEILPSSEGPAPGARWGHAAMWDAHSRSMLIFGGRAQVTFYNDVWHFGSNDSAWRRLPATAQPSARAYHTAILDPLENAVLVLGGESGSQVLEDLQRYSLADGQWSEPGATGAGARSRHTAVWVPTTRSMLVFGGWSGQHYLDDLRSYDASAGTWTDLSASGYWPTARAGHAAAWDPVSMSMLVMGGIANVSNDLSYTSSLYNYSLLTNSWKQEGLQTEVLGPTGRTGHGIVWDYASRGLLSFGGFNVSYLQQTWRYVVSQTSSPLLVSCQLGRNCSFRWNASGVGTVKRACSDPDILAELPPLLSDEAEEDLWMFGGHATPLFAEPGHHRLCWCDTNCSHPDNFSAAVGYFVVEGPQLRQSAQCYLVEFLVVALNLDVICPPGEYNEGIRSAELSVGEHFGRGLKSAAQQRRYWDAESAICLACPAGSWTLQEGATSLASCRCMPGFFTTQLDNPAVCEACGVGFFCTGGLQTRQPCAPSQTTESDSSADESQCVCQAGSFLEDGLCAPCPVGFFKGSVGDFACSPCGTGTFSNGTGSTERCRCRQGYGFDEEIAQCRPCLPGEYKALVGDNPCSRCSTNKTSMEGAMSPLDCQCRSGLAADGETCRDCREGFFCPGQGDELQCQDSATSRVGSILQADCLCLPGHALEAQGICEPCQPGRYKPTLANDPSCLFQCPTNAQSANASTNFADCFCTLGFYAVLDAAGLLSRCASCAFLPHLQCLGGFHTQTGNHTLPVARPGYFQTGVTLAVKCTAITAAGLSACLGGQLCKQVDAVECLGKYENACDEGSTGFLCGECPAGWARSAFLQPCEPCAAGATLPLIAAVIIDVGTKATVSFVVASMAATAAVRASSKLHTVMIRIATQWLAVCSVLAIFDLTQIPVNEVTETWSGEEDTRLFPWPAQVTAAMRGLFETFTLNPILTSIDLAAQCLAKEFSSQSTAPSLAVGVYYLILPLLVILGIVLLSLLVVHGLVPSGKRLGFAFNEVARRQQKQAKAMKSLREAMDQMLSETFPRTSGLPAVAPTSNTPVTFSWVDLERSGALHFHTVAQVQLAADDLDTFLCNTVAGSRELLLRACAARAQAEPQQVHEELAQADLRPFLTTDFAAQFEKFTSMLDAVLYGVRTGATLPSAEASKEAFERSEENDTTEHLEGSEHLGGSESEAAEVALQPIDDTAHETKIAVSQHASSPMVDTVVETLDFGLFSATPRFGELLNQSVPVIWISLVSLWPGLLSSFLQMIWCVPVQEDDVIVNRLLPNPSIVCWSDDHLVSARIAIAGLVVWCLGIPLTLAVRLLLIPDRQSPENFRRFGFFFQGLEPKFWWWDLLVKRLDVALMMLLTYTSVVPDPKGKLMLFPALSGFQVYLAAWVKPYANDQAEILDVVEVTLSAIRFLLFFAVASLLILKPPAATTHAVAYSLLMIIVLACLYLFAHFTAQVLRQAQIEPNSSKTSSSFLRPLGAVKGFVVEWAVPLFTE
ncbi:rngB, partial [Symbiodinium sp. CCMP2456]